MAHTLTPLAPPTKTGKRGRLLILAAVLVLGHGSHLHASQPDDPGLLTLDRLFASGEFRAESYGPVHWLARQGGYARLESSAQVKGAQDIVRIDPATGHREVLVAAAHLIPNGETKPLAIDEFSFSGDESHVLIYTNSHRVWRKNSRGDYWILDVNSRDLHKLGGETKPASLTFASFSPDSTKVAYVRERNIHVEDVLTHKIRQFTYAESPHVLNGTFDWVYEEEFALYEGYRWSPDSQMIAFWQLNTEGVDDYYLLNDTAGLYQQLKKYKYPKAGRPNSACRVGMARVDGNRAEGIPISSTAHFLEKDNGCLVYWLKVPGDPRNHYIPWMDWADGSDSIVVQQLNRLQNANTMMKFHFPTGSVQTLLVESDKTWVDVDPSVSWYDGGKKFTWASERDGWKHIYAGSKTDGKLKLITTGTYDVIDLVTVDEKSGWLYFSASPDNATQKYLYRARLDGSKSERVTPANAPGTHEYEFSPDHRWAIHTHSTIDTPPVIDLVRFPEHKVVRTLADNAKLRDKLKTLKSRPTEFFRVDIGGGVELDGWCMKPHDFDPQKRYPVLFHVYGEPAAQTVLDHWGGANYLWHEYLTQLGYIVMSVDNRGTPAPRGRDWRKVIYRQVGILAPQEQAAAVKALQKRWTFVDLARIGIWGWSGGGSMSLDAIFRYPDLYHTAMAVAPVGNQRYYDTIYQERYMGMPDDNVAGYRDGSPVTHAHKLKGNLLLVHGTGDDNVHYANTEAVIDELIANNKQFTMMAYPNRSHAISEGVNTRRHLYTLLTTYLQKHLPAGGN
jgi:dipeptidyl-peptidase 4